MLLENPVLRRSELVSLWVEAFGDDAGFIDPIFDTVDDLKVFAHKEDGRIVSALYLLDAGLNHNGRSYDGFYVYSCATLRSFRGRGFLSALVEEAKSFAKEEKKDFLSLVPGSRSLYDFYGKLGFQTAMHKFLTENVCFVSAAETDCIKKLTKEEYFSKRAGTDDSFVWAESSVGYVDRTLAYDDFVYCSGNGFIFLYNSVSGQVCDLIADSEKDHTEAVAGIRARFKDGLRSLDGNHGKVMVPYGMLCPLCEELRRDWEPGDIYMNIAME